MNRPLYVHYAVGVWFWRCRGCARKGVASLHLKAMNAARLHYGHCMAAQAWTPESVP